MATNLFIQKTMTWAQAFLKNQPMSIGNMEPALSTGNMVLQTMLGAPFKWRFNRAAFSFPTVPASVSPSVAPVCDYLVNLPDFGYLEDQWLMVGTGATQKVHELGGKFQLARPTGAASRPTRIAAQLDDNAGNITFRLDSMPDQVYTVAGEYQKRAPVLVSLASKLPVPDEFEFVFNWGFLTIISMLRDDPRFPVWEKYFISRLLGLQEGLDEVDVNIFLGLWQTNTKSAMRTQGMVQQGQSGRSQ